MKWLLAAVMVLLFQDMVAANSQYPNSWSVAEKWTAQVQPLGDNWLLHRERPAWQSTDPVLAVVNRNGVVLHRAMSSEDVRAVAIWRNNVVAVRTGRSGTEVFVFDSTLKQRYSTLVTSSLLQPSTKVEILCRPDQTKAFIRYDGQLFLVDLLSLTSGARLIEQGVFGASIGQGKWLALLVHDVGGMAYARLIDTTLHSRIAPSVPLASSAKIGQVGNQVIIISPVDEGLSTQVSIVNTTSGELRTLTLDVPSDLVTWVVQDDKLALAVGSIRDSRPVVTIAFPSVVLSVLGKGIELPAEFGVPERIWSYADTVVVWSANGMATIVGQEVVSENTLDLRLRDYNRGIVYGSTLIATGQVGSVLLKRYYQPWWFLWSIVTIVGPFAVPLVLLIVALIQSIRLRNQKRFLNAMLDVPGAGLTFVLDATGRLLKANEQAAQLLRITPKVPMGRLYRAYMRHRGVNGIQEFISYALDVRRPVSEKIAVDDDDHLREYMVTAQPLWSTLSRFKGLVVTGIDITEALERRRLVNWAQLAHDMQTNLSTVRLNAEQLSTDMGERDQQRVRRILFQTGVLIQRVRDLVSVGRSEELQKSPVHSAEFCTQIRHEFDPEMFPHVTFSMKLRGTMMNVDKLKLSRAVRNAVENAIKSLRGSQGTVEITTWFDRQSVFICVADTGVGMDTLTLENMMKPYFTTAKDGSGTGIGTMIMQHVTHLHGGSLRVTSEPGQGTQVVFRIPIE